MTTFDGGARAIQRQDGTWVTPEDVIKAPVPQPWADLLSEFWGARSLHGAVFRRPQGVVFWHCEGCRVPTNPTGTRTWDGAATTAKQVELLCEGVTMWRREYPVEFVAPIVTGCPEYSMRLTGVETT